MNLPVADQYHSRASLKVTTQHTMHSTQEALPRGITPDDNHHSRSFNSSSSKRPSKNIPIHGSNMHRSDSELQLQESERMAEHRDYCMFTRIVNGMRRNSMNDSSSLHDSWRSDDSLANIIKTRHTPILSEGHFQQLEDRHQDMYPYNIPSLPKALPDNLIVHQDEIEDDSREDDEGIFDMEL